MSISPIKLQEIARISETLAEMCEDDEALFADMVEGETDAVEIVARIAAAIASDQEIVTGIKERAADLGTRRKRYEARIEAGKRAIGMVLRAAKVPKIELPEATWSVRDGKPKLVVTDPEAVPYEFTRSRPEPDKTAINEEFAEAESLPNWLTREPATDIVTQRSR